MLIKKLIVGAFKITHKFFNSTGGKIAAGVIGAAGLAAAGVGVGKAVNAKGVNKKSNRIQNEALERHQTKLDETHEILASLGSVEQQSTHLFARFVELAKRMRRCPSISDFDSKIDLPTMSLYDLKKLSTDLDVALAGVGGNAVGALAGVAFCGVSVCALGFAAFGGGIFLCIKGCKLSKQAAENMRKAKKLVAEVNEIIAYYERLSNASLKLESSIRKVNEIYIKKMDKLEKLIDKNCDYETYSKQEKILVKNVFKLTMLLAKMCDTKLAKTVNDAEVVNEQEVKVIIDEAEAVCQETRQGLFEHVFA